MIEVTAAVTGMMRGVPGLACLLALSTAAVARPVPDAWFGTWTLRPTSPGEAPETLVYGVAGGGAMRMVTVEQGSEIVTRMDGRTAIDTRSKGNRRPALAVKALSPTRYRWTCFRDGKPFVKGVNTLAADRRSFTETSWPVADPTRTVTLVYDRR